MNEIEEITDEGKLYYLVAENELRTGGFNQIIWLEAMNIAEGDIDYAKQFYVHLRYIELFEAKIKNIHLKSELRHVWRSTLAANDNNYVIESSDTEQEKQPTDNISSGMGLFMILII